MSLTAQQLEERKNGIGGSDAAAALGLSPWKTPLELYYEKTGEIEPPDLGGIDAVRFGSLLEPVIRQEYARRNGVEVVFGQPMRRSDKYRWMTCNLDGFVHSTGRVFEAKTSRSADGWGEQNTDEVPQAYLIQCMHAMVVVGAKAADLAVLIAGSEYRQYHIPFNEQLADLVLEGEEHFWWHVESLEPPEATTLKEINLRWRNSVERTVELPPNVAAACARLAEIRESVKELEHEAELAEALVKMEMRDADVGTVDGVPAVTWKQAKPSRVFDAKAFREAMPDLAAKYEIEKQGSRRFLLKA